MKGHKTSERGTTQYDRPWLCYACGHTLDAISDMRGDAVAKPGDILICIACAAVAVYTGTDSRPITAAERESLTPAQRREIEEHRWALEVLWRVFGPVPDRGKRT